MLIRRVAALAAVTLVLGGCGKTTEDDGGNDLGTREQSSVIAADPAASRGPAPDVAGAQKGGTVTILRNNKISHLDPQRAYSFIGLLSSASLYARSLTYWKDDGSGKLTLVGDLAETPGTDVHSDCKTWEFTLKDGLKFEDGSPITSKEVGYGISRSFDPAMGGPTYIQEWLANDKEYYKKWDFTKNKGQLPPGLTTPDPKTVRFTFEKPHCELPYAASLPYTAPVPQAKDTGPEFDNKPFSSGPYKLVRNTIGVEIVFERNENWDPATDPIRHQYPDRYVYHFGAEPDASAQRVVADSGADRSALAWDGVPSSLAQKFATDASLQERTVAAPTPMEWRLAINTRRVTDVDTRRALNYAIDRDGLIKAFGGSDLAQPVTTLMPPGTIGFQNYDLYPAGPTGNPDEAKKLLAGKSPNLVMAVGDGAQEQALAPQIKNNLERAGFTVTVKTVPGDEKDDLTAKPGNEYDLYFRQWAADWPSGASILPPLYDGTTITAEGSNNVSFLNDPAVNAELTRVADLPAAQQPAAWAELDRQIMKDHAPAVPLLVEVARIPTGSHLAGVFISSIFGVPSLVNANVKP
ncbi:ABC transporter [Actinoplanes ianthinogenes]|uniref:ABC transporter n=1 Tax=Actinoplanes ianthinogenes TaxID=122358 RepID=A0ABM7M630_9ACTN|nr:ABC transporter substrate-binding protein [Actinoplanes ianthinogenes]BCJ47115.1 ABC transporter [Actinoplanes ianthinogenes]GGR51797.1 ABC transporter [Actinoplanes ianthinogenes]